MSHDLDDEEYEATRKMFYKDEKPGLYGRTNKGKIIRFAWLQDENGQTMERCVVKFVNGGLIKYWLDKDESIVKHSKNITDLIEVGDVVEIIDVLDQEVLYIWDKEMLDAVKEDIKIGLKLKRILTKEQFDKNCYVVEE